MSAIILESLEAGVVRLVMNRPERMNAIDGRWIDDFHAALDEIEDGDDVRVVILTGAGQAFCAGADLKTDASILSGPDAIKTGYAGMKRLGRLIHRLTLLAQPVIAAVNGPAMGAGLALALAADIRVISSESRFGVANVRIGMGAGDAGISWFFPRLIGLGRSMELMLTGRTFDAEEAFQLGLATRQVSPDVLDASALEIACAIAANPAFGVMMSKEVILANLGASDLGMALALENRTQILCNLTGDMAEAARNFRARRQVRQDDH